MHGVQAAQSRVHSKNACRPCDACQVRDTVAGKIPLRRWGSPEELAGPCVMLCSEAGSYINGATIRVDGGLLARAY